MELIKVTNENGKQLVSGRDLHEALEIGVHFSTWMKRMIDYGFEDGVDFSILKSGNPNGGIARVDDYVITLDMAKHIAMVQRSEMGMRLRNYFIECEKQLQQIQTQPQFTLPTTFKEALLQLVEQVEINEKLEVENKQLTTEVFYKEDVIIGLTKDITLAEKRQLINSIVRYNARGRYVDRWNLLYKEFDLKFHVDTKRRLNNAIDNGELTDKTKRIDYICDKLEMTSELYDVAVKVFESDYKKLMKQKIEVI